MGSGSAYTHNSDPFDSSTLVLRQQDKSNEQHRGPDWDQEDPESGIPAVGDEPAEEKPRREQDRRGDEGGGRRGETTTNRLRPNVLHRREREVDQRQQYSVGVCESEKHPSRLMACVEIPTELKRVQDLKSDPECGKQKQRPPAETDVFGDNGLHGGASLIFHRRVRSHAPVFPQALPTDFTQKAALCLCTSTIAPSWC